MVVSPRYAEYEDTVNTGTSVPLLLPPATSSHSPSADTLPPGDSLSSLTGSQDDASTPSQPDKESATQACEVHPSHQNSGAAPGKSTRELTNAEQQQNQDTAQYYLCQRSGVDHVFVDHPLYCRTSDIYGSSNVNTYQEAGDFPDLDLRYSILCQAALAAPLLLWQKSACSQPQHRLAEADPGEGDVPEQDQDGGTIGVQAHGRPEEVTPVMPQLHARLPEALHLEPASDTSVSMSPPAHGAARSPECRSAAAASPVTAQASTSSESATDAAVQANALHLQGSNLAAPTQADKANDMLSAMPQRRGAHEAYQQADVQQMAAGNRLQGSRSGAEHGQTEQPGNESAPLVFVSNDWPCAPLALRLKHTLQSAQTPVDASALPRCASQDGEADPCSASGQLAGRDGISRKLHYLSLPVHTITSLPWTYAGLVHDCNMHASGCIHWSAWSFAELMATSHIMAVSHGEKRDSHTDDDPIPGFAGEQSCVIPAYMQLLRSLYACQMLAKSPAPLCWPYHCHSHGVPACRLL